MNLKNFKTRISEARQRLGPELSDEILAQTRKLKGVHRLTLKEKVSVLESALQKPAAIAAKPDRLTPIAGAKTRSDEVATNPEQLLRVYEELASTEARRAFFQKHEKTLTNPKARVPGLVLVCMASGKPLSTRAKLQLPASNGIELTRQEFLALSPRERGQFQERGGKIVRETLARSLFEKLPAADRAEFCRNGGTLN